MAHGKTTMEPPSDKEILLSTETLPDGLSPRLWPLIPILALQVLTLLVSITPSINNAVRFGFMMLGPAMCVLLFLVWLLGFSRLSWRDRLVSLLVALGLGGAAIPLVDTSMAVPLWIYGAPLSMAVIAFGLWAGESQRPALRSALLVAMLAATWGVFPFFRLEGFTGGYLPEFSWRWAKLQSGGSEKTVSPEDVAAWKPATVEWPGFRGPEGDSRVAASGANVDWKAAPEILWRVPMGAAWSSFAHVSGHLFTQEQQGDEEMVTCLDAATGRIVWRSGYPCKFFDVVAGAGPRATPTYIDGKLFTYGAKAHLTCLDAASGKILWQRDLMKEVNAQLPVWGFSSSPLAVGKVAVVYAGGDGDNGLMAFNRETGEPAWRMASGGMNFSSAQRVALAGTELVLFGDGGGLTALAPDTGAVAWEYTPKDWNGPAICQPQQVAPESLIVPLGDGAGVARLEVTKDGDAWRISERWVCKKFKPSFNDFVFYKGHCYGFDNNAFACLDADTGEVTWKHRGYKFGQVLLLEDAGVLAVTTESGGLALVAAEPQAHRELGQYELLTGKTWNHPVAAAGRLFVRNGEEAVAVSLSRSPEKPA